MNDNYDTYLCRSLKIRANRQDLSGILEIFNRAIGSKMDESQVKEWQRMIRFFGEIDNMRLDYVITTDNLNVVRCIKYSDNRWGSVSFIGDKGFANEFKSTSSAIKPKLLPVLIGLCIWSFLVAAIANEVLRNGF